MILQERPLWRFVLSEYHRNHFKQISENEITIDVDGNIKLNLLVLLLAISSVKHDYLSLNDKPLDEIKDCYSCKKRTGNENDFSNADKNILYERTFAYELYRQWQNLLESLESPLHVDAEIGKKLSNNSIDFQKLKSMKGAYKEPDLVLHKSQGNDEEQTFVCEIKRNVNLDDEKIEKDLIKLCHFIDPCIWGGKPYKYGVFIVVKKNFNELTTQIVGLKRQLYSKMENENLHVDISKLLCISYDGDIVQYDTLNNILKI